KTAAYGGFRVSLEVRHSEANPGVAVMKRVAGALEADRALQSQLQVMSFPGAYREAASDGALDQSPLQGSSVFEVLQLYARQSFAAVVSSYARGEGEDEGDSGKPRGALPQLQRKIRELELALVQCQKRQEIPSVNLTPHKTIAKAAAGVPPGGKIDLEALGLSDYLQDDAFLNDVQGVVNGWVKDIQRLTRLTHTPFPDTAIEEVNFWSGLGEALRQTEEELPSTGVQITVALLKQAKRFLATVALENNTAGLKDALEISSDVMTFLRSFPVHALLSASDLPSINASLLPLFNHFGKLKNSKHYEMERAAKLLESVTHALATQVHAVLKQQSESLLRISYPKFQERMGEVTTVFGSWKSGYESFEKFFLDRCKKRAKATKKAMDGQGILKSLHFEHEALMKRLQDVAAFREQHEKFRDVVEMVLSQPGEDGSALPELEEAYGRMQAVDVLDVSKEGEADWEAAREGYDHRVDRVEERITRLLQNKLRASKTAEEMFRVFRKFSPLLSRPAIRLAIAQFQADLTAHVRSAVSALQETFTKRYEDSQARKVAQLRDIPPVAGKILWARQIERQLMLLMKRMEDVLGAGWEKHLEGKKLKGTFDSLMKQIDTNRVYMQWLEEWKHHGTAHTHPQLSMTVSSLVTSKGMSGEPLLAVNFDEKTVTLFKEVRHLQWMDFEVPQNSKKLVVKIQELAAKCSKRYPTAVALQSTLRTYAQTMARLDESTLRLLVPYLMAIRGTVAESFAVKDRMHWDSPQVEGFCSTLSEQINTLQEKADELLGQTVQVGATLEELKTCPFTSNAMSELLGKVQQIVDGMSLAGLSNLHVWVQEVDSRVDEVLAQRLKQAVELWVEEFGSDSSESIPFECSVHEVLLRNQVLYLDPPLEYARAMWIRQFHQYLGTVAELQRLKSSRFAVLGESSANEAAVLAIVPKALLQQAYDEIESQLAEVAQYVQSWLQYQSLWDVDVQHVCDQVGEDVLQWTELLQEAKAARSLIESTSTEKSFGAIVIDYRQVQSKVNLKYDVWQKELQGRFGSLLSDSIHREQQMLTEAKAKLESVSLDGSTNDVIRGVTYIQEMGQRQQQMQSQLKRLEAGEKLLLRQRYQFPADWPQSSQLVATYSGFSQILGRRNATMESRIPALQQRVRAEEKVAEKRVADLVQLWTESKPLGGEHKPREALEVVDGFNVQVRKAREDYDRLSAAKEALSLGAPGEDVLASVEEEMRDLREVWNALDEIWGKTNELEEMSWAAAVPRKVRRALDDLMEQMRGLPNKIRQYEAYSYAQGTLKGHIASHPMLLDLKTEALKERHWKALLRRLNIRVAQSELSLGHLWGAKLEEHKQHIHDTVATAQGEMALEEFLRSVRDHWAAYELELVSFEGRVRLIKGWDEVFARLEEHLNSLASMKQSPYFKAVSEFQEEASLWEDRLTKLQAILDAWLEVQRRWVYLAGIFFGAADIKAQLPAEHARFKSVDNEFIQLMRRVSHKPAVLEVLGMDNLLRQLERQDSIMTKIQKALGEYLERQRAAFSRFYFVGDEDLLEIIGNSKEPGKVIKHLSKMFASMSNLTLEGEGDALVAAFMISKDAEEVRLTEQVPIAGQVVKDWLGGLEKEMHRTLATLLMQATEESKGLEGDAFVKWVGRFPAQIVALAVQVSWSAAVDAALKSVNDNPRHTTWPPQVLLGQLELMAESVLLDVPPQLRKKYEQLVTEMVHKRDVTRSLLEHGNAGVDSFKWLCHLRFYLNPQETDTLQRLRINMADAAFFYGFEYLGIGERLVQTPLTDRCYLTLTQALHLRMGGSPFGPAGTGKFFLHRNPSLLTESVKSLGAQLGRFVLVFNCDESFDYGAMGRLFAGLCQVGAWGCFDEFNRLEERILSAVSQQILAIQRGLSDGKREIPFLGRSIGLNPNLGIFITMNPGYAGRSNLPDNLKQLFRAVAMVVPDRRLIAQVMLFSQGIVTAEELAGKIVLLFQLCQEQLSVQSHYDFGLRALKSVLVGAGGLKRAAVMEANEAGAAELAMSAVERDVLIRSACDTLVPKLVAEDVALFSNLLSGVFPGCKVEEEDAAALEVHIQSVCEQQHLVLGGAWAQKVLQLKQVLALRHGVMLVGPSGTGKSSAWRTLLAALELLDGIKGEAHVIDPKAIGKEALYGSLDPTTLEWTDGVFTRVLRDVLANRRGGGQKRHWIVFDGDVDPEWAENLNSVLDDNKLLTLPSGERLELPSSVRILLEVDSLRYATLATVSRCGMVWFSGSGEGTVTTPMLLEHTLKTLGATAVTSSLSDGESLLEGGEVCEAGSGQARSNPEGRMDPVQTHFVELLAPFMTGGSSLIETALEHAMSMDHVMEVTRERLACTLVSLLQRGIALVLDYNEAHRDFPLEPSQLETFVSKWVLYALLWGFGGSTSNDARADLAEKLIHWSGMHLEGSNLVDMRVDVATGEWLKWSDSVPRMEIESHKVVASDVVVVTTDTVRHVDILEAWLASHKPLILCGPPGSGKTMTLTSTLQGMPNLVLASLNFSSGTTPKLLLKTFRQYCEYVRTPHGVVMQPAQSLGLQKWLVVFCDEINLPANDSYGTQRVITFMRQLTEQGGFWRDDCVWVTLRRVQFVGACNPPTDAGMYPCRVRMSPRFMRHAPILLVNFPTSQSLHQIYAGTFTTALLKLHPPLKGLANALTDAMIEFYEINQERFTRDQQPQYIYSPRELSRWVRALYEAMSPVDDVTEEELVRLWGHEALRLFHDRLVTVGEREWCQEKVDEVASKHFPRVNIEMVLSRPLLYSSWLTKHYTSASRESLREFVAARLRVFYEEELDVPLVIFNDVLEHVLRIDRVLRQPMGHLLLVGESGAGKTVLSKYVSWMNGLSVFQIKANRRYSLEEFDDDLRAVMRRAGCGQEKICFIFDESNVLSSAFLERMNALLASGEVPGLFEADEHTALMAACREAAQRDGAMTDSEEELFRRFTGEVQRNLHVVFTMNPASADFSNRCMTSPALFNRCVVNWVGTWSRAALAQVGCEFTAHLDTSGAPEYSPPAGSGALLTALEGLVEGDSTIQHAIVAALVRVHGLVKATTEHLGKRASTRHFLSPRDFLDLIKTFVNLVSEKRGQLAEQQLHINVGLEKLHETQSSVAALQRGLSMKEVQLQEKDALANSKLQQMVAQQNEAEKSKATAETLTVNLERQNKEIAARRQEAETELSEAEPALLQAQASVRSIKKAQLDEIRALARPPAAVKTTLEAVCVMLGHGRLEWGDLRKVIAKQDFIATVVNFDTDTLTEEQISTVTEIFTSAGDLTVETVQRASKACGPLFQWVTSQIAFSRIAMKVQPLRDEVATLQRESDALTARKDELLLQIEELERSIATFKEEYAEAIREMEAVKTEMEAVKQKVSRAEGLLMNLEQEKDRWESGCRSFEAQLATLLGDCLLSAAFVTYAGIFDYRNRTMLLEQWQEVLETVGINFRSDISLLDYLSRAADRLMWQGQGLPSDELCMENAIILERFNRFPLIVDPGGQATSYLMNRYQDRKIAKTSFLDSSFMKTLASAIRFGMPLLVQDVESIDPILNPLLNKELHKTGGRTLIRLGGEDIDFSPKFMIFLTTRNPAAQFTPDLCSRVTMVNFTVTPASLRSQALSNVLKAERPDVDRKRTQVMQLQGEQSVKLRQLEERLLDTISAVQGNILDDDTVIKALEDLKKEAGDVAQEVERTEEVMSEVMATSNLYEPIADACSRVYFAMAALSEIHFLYQFSLGCFLEVLDGVLSASPTTKGKDIDPGDRLEFLRRQVFAAVAKRVARGLLHCDKLVFTLRLAQILLSGDASKEPADMEMDLLLKGSAGMQGQSQVKAGGGMTAIGSIALTERQKRELQGLTLLPSCAKLLASISEDEGEWEAFLLSDAAENAIPTGWMQESDPCRMAFLRLLLVNALRPDRTMSAAELFVTAVLGPDFPWNENLETLDIEPVKRTVKAATPILICSEPGHDASWKVDALAEGSGKSMASVAMGSAEGYDMAEKAISAAARSGTWVLLRNIHLCPDWLSILEKRLHALQAHSDFCLFLTSDIHPKLPVSLLRASDVVVVEAPTGVRANVLRFLQGIPKERMERPPVERNRLYVLLAWLHAITLERLRYTPTGWSKRYEFSEADANCALIAVDNWVDTSGGGKAHVNPESIPWDALRTLLSQSIYGGRVDSTFDQELMESFVGRLFSPSAFDVDFPLSTSLSEEGKEVSLAAVPEASSYEGILEWAEGLPHNNPPTWLGLSSNAEAALLVAKGSTMISSLLMIQDRYSTADINTVSLPPILDELEELGDGGEEGGGHHPSAGKLEGLLMLVERWLDMLPKEHFGGKYSSEADSKDALHRCLCREVALGQGLLRTVQGDLHTVQAFCRGDTKGSNDVRSLVSNLLKDAVPERWSGRFVAAPLAAGAWLEDLGQRLSHLKELSEAKENESGATYWLGGLFSPEAFITATRQFVAQANGCSLDELSLSFHVGSSKELEHNASSFAISGLVLEGASWDDNLSQLAVSSQHSTPLPISELSWVKTDNSSGGPESEGAPVVVPLYLNSSRMDLIVEVGLTRPAAVSVDMWRQRGTALISWNHNG
ncbi:unnamed protein product, partial [Chrysoparadoxa australica]